MTRRSIRRYLTAQRERYLRAGRKGQTALPDEMVAVTGDHRKSIVRAWIGHAPDATKAAYAQLGRVYRLLRDRRTVSLSTPRGG